MIGTAAALYYSAAGLALAHYDARAHLVVARRIIDSLTPGWQQVGAVWLPLPHLLNMLPVQIDVLYRTGASAIAHLGREHGGGRLGDVRRDTSHDRLAERRDRRRGAAALESQRALPPEHADDRAAALRDAHALGRAHRAGGWNVSSRWRRRRRGCALAAACLTRYEAWPVTAAIVVLAAARPDAARVLPVRALVRAMLAWRAIPRSPSSCSS